MNILVINIGGVNGKCMTLGEGKIGIFLCKSERIWPLQL